VTSYSHNGPNWLGCDCFCASPSAPTEEQEGAIVASTTGVGLTLLALAQVRCMPCVCLFKDKVMG